MQIINKNYKIMFKFKFNKILSENLNGGILSHSQSAIVNDFLMREHRYLQGTLFNLILRYIKSNAIHYQNEPNRWFDGRNEFVGKICQSICQNTPDLELFDNDELIDQQGQEYASEYKHFSEFSESALNK